LQTGGLKLIADKGKLGSLGVERADEEDGHGIIPDDRCILKKLRSTES
jgi:hypothetical protein